MELALAGSRSEQELETVLRRLHEERAAIVLNDEPVSNRFYDKAARRIAAGVIAYGSDPRT
ncbi:hypothetical protein WKI71_00100 [Streptomyces sp. MS1.AVA.1]|uniref:Uncharacterized protein n=1 Tax=Streptomyces machairae TaxID=3134109 RepID=A0ABU8UF50_9ACTN